MKKDLDKTLEDYMVQCYKVIVQPSKTIDDMKNKLDKAPRDYIKN